MSNFITPWNKLSPRGKVKEVLLNVGLYIMLFFLAFIILFPVVWIIGSSLNQGTSLATARAIPKHPTLDNFVRLFEETKYLSWYGNTLLIALVNMFASVVLTASTGYVFARLKFAGKKFGLLSILILQMFPTFMGMIAIYILFLNFGLLNQPLALVLIYATGQIPYNTWLVKGYLNNVPKALDEAAAIDGASKFQTYIRIILPVMFPILTFIAVTQFMVPWFDFILPSFLISSDEKRTLAVGLVDLITGQSNNNFTMFAAGAVLVAVPVAILYLFLQKYLVQGLTAGANKG